MILKKVGAFGARAIQSPLTSKIVRGAKVGAEIAGMAGVPGATALSKGLGVAEKVLTAMKD